MKNVRWFTAAVLLALTLYRGQLVPAAAATVGGANRGCQAVSSSCFNEFGSWRPPCSPQFLRRDHPGHLEQGQACHLSDLPRIKTGICD